MEIKNLKIDENKVKILANRIIIEEVINLRTKELDDLKMIKRIQELIEKEVTIEE